MSFFRRFSVVFFFDVVVFIKKLILSLSPLLSYLEGHHDLDGVERVRAEVDELGVRGDLREGSDEQKKKRGEKKKKCKGKKKSPSSRASRCLLRSTKKGQRAASRLSFSASLKLTRVLSLSYSPFSHNTNAPSRAQCRAARR